MQLSGSGGVGGTSTTTIDFSAVGGSGYQDSVKNVQFRINDIDQGGWEDIVTVLAYDEFGQAVAVGITITGNETESGGVVTAGPGGDQPSDANGSVLFTIPGPVAQIVIDYDNGDTGGQALYVTDIEFEAVAEGAHDDVVEAGAGNDSIDSGLESDTVFGGTGDDTIHASYHDDTLYGGDDSDTFVLGEFTGNDVIFGGEGGTDDDVIDASALSAGVTVTYTGDESGTVSYGSYTTTFTGIERWILTNADDVVDASASTTAVTVSARGGDDTMTGGSGDDEFYGGDDDDTFIVQDGYGADSITGDDGGTDSDTLDASGLTSGVTLNFTGAEDGTIADGTDTATFDGFESFTLTAQADTVNGSLNSDSMTITAGAGADVITGGTGIDTLFGGDDGDFFTLNDNFANDAIFGGEGGTGTDRIDGSAITSGLTVTLTSDEAGTFSDGSDTATFTAIEDFVLSAQADTIDGSLSTASMTVSAGAGADAITGSSGADTLNGGADGDTFTLADGFGSDSITGGETGTDADILDASSLSAGATVNLTGSSAGTLTDGSDTATFAELEEFVLTSSADTFDGAAGSDSVTVTAGAGDDALTGGSGDDTLYGGDDSDTFYLEDGYGSDSIVGGEGGSDNDTIDGSALTGNATVTFTGDEAGTFNDGTDTATFSEIETLVLTDQDDTVDGAASSSSMTIFGGDGQDEIVGGSGDDSLSGGDGADTIYGDSTGTYGAQVTSITIDNYSFEDNVLADGVFTYTLADWTQTGDAFGTGEWNPEAADMDESSLTGDNLAWLYYDGDTISQTFTQTYLDGETYDFTFDIGDTTEGASNYTVNIYAGATLIGSTSGTTDGTGSLSGASVSSNGYSDDLLDGQSISLEFVINSGGELGVDNVQGTASNPNPPGSYNDTIVGGAGDDTIYGGEGDDSIAGDAGDDGLYGGIGDDTLNGGDDADTVFLEDNFGADTITGGEGGTDSDTLDASAVTTGVTAIFTGDEAGTISDGGDTATFAEMEALILTEADDTANASATSTGQTISGLGGDDTLTGGTGDDSLDGGDDDDSIIGGAGDDAIAGGDGADIIRGNGGDDTAYGGDGDDDIRTGGNNDLVYGGIGADDIRGNSGNDTLFGDAGTDTLRGGTGNDTISGGDDADSIFGQGGDDFIYMGTGDNAAGGNGDDYFLIDGSQSGTGAITVAGGEGGETTGDTLDFNGLLDWGSLVISNPDDGAGGLSGTALLQDGTVVNFAQIENIICFARGTSVLTGVGERRIETLKAGDQILTYDNGLKQIRWIGSKTVSATGGLAPIVFEKGVLGNHRELIVSPQHRMLICGPQTELLFGQSEVLIPAKYLLNWDGVSQVESGEVEYFHMLFDNHEVIFSEGALAESFHPGEEALNSVEESCKQEILELFPELRDTTDNYGSSARFSLRAFEAEVLALSLRQASVQTIQKTKPTAPKPFYVPSRRGAAAGPSASGKLI